MPIPPNTPAITVQYLWQASQARLSNARFWTDDELRSYAIEAVRTWNALTDSNKKRVALPVPAASDQIRDLAVELAADRGYLYTDQDLAAFCQYHLLEPVAYPAWTGSIQFTMADILTAIARRRDQFLLETGISQSIYLSPDGPDEAGAAPPSGRLTFKYSVLAVRRVAWQDSTSLQWDVLFRSDEFAARSFSPIWTLTPGLPKAYSDSVEPTFDLQLLPAPINAGQAQLIVVPAGDQPDTAAPTPVTVNVPSDWAWAVKWGALCDLLSKDGPARDTDRAAYCQHRYELAVRVARSCTSVLTAYINEVPVTPSTIFNFDCFRPGWQNTTGEPGAVAMAAVNLLCLDKKPTVDVSVAMDIVANSDLPAVGSAAVDGDVVQVGRDVADVLVGYIEHLAAFKMAGAEFLATVPRFQELLNLAGVYSKRMQAEATYASALMNRPRVQEDQVPYLSRQQQQVAAGVG
jgi:hypothetical protein